MAKAKTTPKRLSTSQVLASDAKLVTHEEGLLVERPSLPPIKSGKDTASL